MPLLVLKPALVLAALFTMGCGADRIVVVERIADAGVDDADSGSEGCDSPTVVPGYAVTSIDIDGGARSYGLFVPAGDVHTPRPLVFGFDGHGTSQECRDALHLEEQADGAAIFVYPENKPDADGVRSWQSDDLGNLTFFDTLVATLEQSACVTRVFIAGYSSGASWTTRLGCLRGGVVRGIAPFAGGSPISGCGDEKVAALFTYGDVDTLVAPAAARDHWIAQNGCGKTSHPVTPDPCVSYDGCDPAYPVTWCEFSGGHLVPAWAPAAAWSFFAALH